MACLRKQKEAREEAALRPFEAQLATAQRARAEAERRAEEAAGRLATGEALSGAAAHAARAQLAQAKREEERAAEVVMRERTFVHAQRQLGLLGGADADAEWSRPLISRRDAEYRERAERETRAAAEAAARRHIEEESAARKRIEAELRLSVFDDVRGWRQ